jgi:Skp family chaperone for outer membrane proteins
MRQRAGLLPALLFAALSAGAAAAQSDPPDIVVIDQERLFQESVLGREVADELEARSEVLANENRAIEAELIAEERSLTERRAELAPDEFRKLADAFDERVDRLRAEQDAKARELVSVRDAGRQNFTRTVGPILLEYMRRTGASVMLDRRSVVAAADRVDVTDEVIAEIDAMVGKAGSPAEMQGADAPAAAQDAAPPPVDGAPPPDAAPPAPEPGD